MKKYYDMVIREPFKAAELIEVQEKRIIQLRENLKAARRECDECGKLLPPTVTGRLHR